jgi:glutamate synthase domain-containing protein 3
MSNGVAYVLDESGRLPSRTNHDLVLLADLDEHDEALVQRLLALHRVRTASPRARALLDGWTRTRMQWRKVQPRGAGEHVAAIRAHWSARIDAMLEAESDKTSAASITV